MSRTRKCQAEGGVARCRDPKCPEKQVSISSLAEDFDSRLNKLNAAAEAGQVRLNPEVLSMFGFTPKSNSKNYMVGDAAFESQVAAGADYVMSEFNELQIMNQNPDVGGQFIMLQDLKEPSVARQNSWAVTSELLESTTSGDFGVDELTMVNLESPSHTHTALYAVKDGESLVIDFTARQFDSQAAFPMVAKPSEWRRFVNSKTGSKAKVVVGATEPAYV